MEYLLSTELEILNVGNTFHNSPRMEVLDIPLYPRTKPGLLDHSHIAIELDTKTPSGHRIPGVPAGTSLLQTS